MKILLEMVENDQAYSDTLMHISNTWDKVNSISLYSKNMFPTENYAVPYISCEGSHSVPKD